MIRRLLLTLSVAGVLASGQAAAQSAAASETIAGAKAQGMVGEQADGFLGLVSGSPPPSVVAAVRQINAGRAQAYDTIAAKTGVTDEAAGEATARQLYDRLPPGQFFKPLGGPWTRK